MDAHDVLNRELCFIFLFLWVIGGVARIIRKSSSAESICILMDAAISVLDCHVASVFLNRDLPPQHVSIGGLHVQQ
jgi:hypothetical protein